MVYTYRNLRPPHSDLLAWRAVAEEDGRFVDAGNEFWGFAFDRSRGGDTTAWLLGPSMQPREMQIRAGDVSWGLELPAHLYSTQIAKRSLVDAINRLPVERDFVEIAAVRFPIPVYDAMETFVEALLGQGILRRDPVVSRVLAGGSVCLSERQLRRRAAHAAGLSPKQIEQLRRARKAHRLIREGYSLSDAAQMAGYADQAHMTRALSAVSGSTPSRLATGHAGPFMSRP